MSLTKLVLAPFLSGRSKGVTKDVETGPKAGVLAPFLSGRSKGVKPAPSRT